MLRGKTRREDRQAEQSASSGSPLSRLIPFAIAFVAGFLFGRRRGGGGDGGGGGEGGDGGSGGGGGRLARLKSIVPGGRAVEEPVSEGFEEASERVEGAVPEEVEEAAPEAVTPGGEGGGGGEAQGTETTEQPSSMGSVSGEEARQSDREGEAEGEGAATEGEAAEAEGGEGETETEIPDEVQAVEAPVTHGMPMFGLGTYQMEDYDDCVEAVRTAVEMGYRHIDTAEGYENEDAVGDAIAEADVDREDLFVATKVSPDNLDYDQVLTSAEESLDRLGVEYVDLLYVHWPTGDYDATDTLDAFAELRNEGVIEEIGVSNFEPEQLAEAVDVAEEPIFANQVEMHPLLQQTELQSFCGQDDVDVELVAYSPIARGDVDDVEELQEIAEKHGVTPAQVSLAWLREKGVTAIPKASSEDHLRENWLSLAVELDDEDVERIDDIEREERVVDPDRAPWNE